MNPQIKLGKVFGIEIGLHYSWFLIALLIATSLYSQFHSKNPEWGDGVIVAMAVVIACFVIHRHPLTGTGEGTKFSGA